MRADPPDYLGVYASITYEGVTSIIPGTRTFTDRASPESNRGSHGVHVDVDPPRATGPADQEQPAGRRARAGYVLLFDRHPHDPPHRPDRAGDRPGCVVRPGSQDPASADAGSLRRRGVGIRPHSGTTVARDTISRTAFTDGVTGHRPGDADQRSQIRRTSRSMPAVLLQAFLPGGTRINRQAVAEYASRSHGKVRRARSQRPTLAITSPVLAEHRGQTTDKVSGDRNSSGACSVSWGCSAAPTPSTGRRVLLQAPRRRPSPRTTARRRRVRPGLRHAG